MGYDQKTVDAAKKSGILESAFDAGALSLDDDEKSAMLNKLSAVQFHNEPEAAKQGRKKGREEKKRANSFGQTMSDFFQKMMNFFRSFFASSSKEGGSQKKELREIEKILSSFAVPVYDSKQGFVRAAFMAYLQQLHQKIEEFHKFFTHNFTVGADDFILDRSPSFARTVIELLLTLDQSRLLKELRALDMKKNMVERGEDVAQREIERNIAKFSDSFAGGDIHRIEDSLGFYTAIVNLQNYNFKAVFSLFRPGDARDEHLHDFSLEYCIEQMRNLDTYLARLDFTKLREEHYRWFDIFNDQITGAPDIPKYHSDDFRMLVGLLRKLTAYDVVGNLIRIGTSNPAYRAQPVRDPTSWVDMYRQLADASFKNKLERSILHFREEQIQMQVGELFEGYRSFVWHPIINNDTNMKIENLGGPQFTNAFLFNLLWNYAERIYLEHYKRSVNTIAVEGSFRKKETGVAFNDTYHELDSLYSRMEELYTRTNKESPFATRLANYLTGNMGNAVAVRTFEDEVTLLNSELFTVAQQCGLCLMNLFKFMESVVFDFKALQSGNLLNAKTIGGVSNRNLLTIFEKFLQNLRKIEPILSRFIVVREQIPPPGGQV
jgi:hypothetical protein